MSSALNTTREADDAISVSLGTDYPDIRDAVRAICKRSPMSSWSRPAKGRCSRDASYRAARRRIEAANEGAKLDVCQLWD
jgi:hypothetical protein